MSKDIVYQIPEIEEDTLDDALHVVNTRCCTVLMNLLGITHPLHTRVLSMYPYPLDDYIYDGMYVPIPVDEYGDPEEPVIVDGAYPDDATQKPYVVLDGGVPKERSLSLWYVNKENEIEPINVVIPNMLVHICHNSRVHKSYCEFNCDRRMLNYLRITGVYSEFRDKACKKIYNEYKDEMGLNERIFMVRPRKYCPKEYTLSNILTIGTVGHWLNMQGMKEFLNDNIETELAFTQYKMKHLDSEQAYFRKLEEFAQNVHEINSKLSAGTYDHDKAFKTYRDYFNEEFKDEYKKINPSTGVEETLYYYPLYDFYEKFYLIYFDDLIPDTEE